MIGFHDLPACKQENYNVIISHLPHSPIMQSVKSCCAANFLCHVLKALFFIKIVLKLSYFCKKMKNFQALGAPPPDPQNSPPHCELQASRLDVSKNKLKFISLNPKFLEFSTGLFRIIDVTIASCKNRIFNS